MKKLFENWRGWTKEVLTEYDVSSFKKASQPTPEDLNPDPNLQLLYTMVMEALPLTKFAGCEINLEALNKHPGLRTGEWVLPRFRNEGDAKGVEKHIEQHNLVIC